MPLAEGDVVTLRFDRIAPKGDAVATDTGDRPVFVGGLVPGELATVRVRKLRRNWIAADLVSIDEPSPHRVVPRCPLFYTCNGCQLQHVDYPHQLELKRAMVREQLERFGGLTDAPVNPVIAAPSPWGYRNHARFTVSEGRLGFVRRFRRQFMEVPHCDLMDPAINALLERLGGKLQGATQCNVRVGQRTGSQMVQPKLEIAEQLGVSTGQPHVTEQLGGHEFRVSAPAFFQVNTGAAERLHAFIREQIPGGGTAKVIDAYAGVGTFAVTLAPLAERVIAIESSGPAVEDAQLNTRDFTNIELRLGLTEQVLTQMAEAGDAADLVLLDPPRSGCLPEALAAVRKLAPSRILYISCDPATLARDLQILLEGDDGFVLRQVQPVDMFPQTHHVECVAVLDAKPRVVPQA